MHDSHEPNMSDSDSLEPLFSYGIRNAVVINLDETGHQDWVDAREEKVPQAILRELCGDSSLAEQLNCCPNTFK